MTALIDEIDAAAAELLKRATAPDKDESDNPTLVTLAERTKAFDSVVKWAMERKDLVQPERAPSKFEQIKGALDGTGKPRRRRGTPGEATEGEVGAVDAGGSISVNGGVALDGLFAT